MLESIWGWITPEKYTQIDLSELQPKLAGFYADPRIIPLKGKPEVVKVQLFDRMRADLATQSASMADPALRPVMQEVLDAIQQIEDERKAAARNSGASEDTFYDQQKIEYLNQLLFRCLRVCEGQDLAEHAKQLKLLAAMLPGRQQPAWLNLKNVLLGLSVFLLMTIMLSLTAGWMASLPFSMGTSMLFLPALVYGVMMPLAHICHMQVGVLLGTIASSTLAGTYALDMTAFKAGVVVKATEKLSGEIDDVVKPRR